MTTTDTEVRFKEFLDTNPAHDCPGEGCEHGASYYLLVRSSPGEKDDAFQVSSETHNISPTAVVQSFIEAFDRSMMESKPDDMPASIAWTYGREIIKKLAEEIDPPADISANLSDFIRNMIDGMTKDTDDE